MTNFEPQPLRILFIAPTGSGASATNVIGGNRVSTEDALRELGQRGFELDVLDTSGNVTLMPPWQLRLFRLARYIRVMYGLARKARRSHLVFLFIAPSSAAVLALSVWLLCKIARRPMVLRLSGADFSLVYHNYSALTRRLAQRTWMRADLITVETQQLCHDFAGRGNFRWFPTTRDVQPPTSAHRVRPDRLIFVSRLEMDKGFAEALEACRALPQNCHLKVFGPRLTHTNMSLFDGHPRASYGGVLEPEDVPRVLAEHDLLLFPSYYEMEGYPGVVIEAFQCGLPVIAASWRSVPDLVIHEENGLLVEPRSAEALRSAIERLLADTDLFQSLCAGALRQGERFRSVNWYDRMADDLRELCRP